jgi:hypothetical protein
MMFYHTIEITQDSIQVQYRLTLNYLWFEFSTHLIFKGTRTNLNWRTPPPFHFEPWLSGKPKCGRGPRGQVEISADWFKILGPSRGGKEGKEIKELKKEKKKSVCHCVRAPIPNTRLWRFTRRAFSHVCGMKRGGAFDTGHRWLACEVTLLQKIKKTRVQIIIHREINI